MQGSCLGLSLFIIFVNDIHLLPTYSKIILFADDTTIFNSHQSIKFLQYTLENDMKLLLDWFRVNKLSLNLTKSVTMKFWKNNKDFSVNVDGVQLPTVTCTKFLRVHVDHELIWTNHVNKIIDKIRNN